MKKIIILSTLFCISIACKAQIIPVEGVDEYKKTNNTGIPDGAYIKDVNGVFNKYIGTWKTTYNNRIYTFFITKKTTTSYEIQMDKLYIKYLITELNGTVVEDTRNDTGNSIFGDKFTDDAVYYILGFSGKNSNCGNTGNFYLSYVSPTQIQLLLVYGGGIVRGDLCQGYDIEKEPVFPLSKAKKMTLTKQ